MPNSVIYFFPVCYMNQKNDFLKEMYDSNTSLFISEQCWVLLQYK